MLCNVGTHAVYLCHPVFFCCLSLPGIEVVYLLVLMLCIVGTHAVDLWPPLFFLTISFGYQGCVLVGADAVHCWYSCCGLVAALGF